MSVDPQFINLVDRYLTDTLSDAEFKQLEEALSNDRELRDYYRKMARMDAHLGILAETEADASALPPVPRAHVRANLPAIAAILALALTCATLIFHQLRAPEAYSMAAQTIAPADAAALQNLATLTHAIDATWTQGPERHRGSGIGPERLIASEGLFQIDFKSGVSMVARAPLDLELIDPLHVRCRKGTLRLRVPYHARGFRILTDQTDVVDLGTEFGMTVDENNCDLQVFDGEIEVHAKDGKEPRHLLAGEQWSENVFSNPDFPTPEELENLHLEQLRARHTAWNEYTETLRNDPTLRLLYTFDRPAEWDRRLINHAPEMATETEGFLNGCRWTDGRWPDKTAVEFKQFSDAIRIRDDRELQSMTLMASIRIDGLDRQLSSILTSDGWPEGAIHWQFRATGVLEFSLHQPGWIMYSKTAPVLEQRHLGQWLQLAVTYDHTTGEVTHYLNGNELSSRPLLNRKPVSSYAPFKNGRSILGPAHFGNWATAAPTMIRNLNGRLDHFALYSRVLTPAEIRASERTGTQ